MNSESYNATMEYQREVEVARALAEKAGMLQLEFLSGEKNIELKEDQSPVTVVDKRCEELIRTGILEVFPHDGFMGEESGHLHGTSGRTWIVDPIDGTRPYIRQIPTYSTLIGLEEHGEIIVGIMHFAGMNETYWGSKGGGAFCSKGPHTPLKVSTKSTLESSMCSVFGMLEVEGPLSENSMKIAKEAEYCYGFMDAYSYALVAAGKLDFVVSLLDKPWDKSPAICVIREAGGCYTTLNGENTIYTDGSLFSNGAFHEVLLAKLGQT